MIPLRVTAWIRGEIMLTVGGVEIDGLLMYVRARELGYPPPSVERREPPDIPIARSECGRVYMCTTGLFDVETTGLHKIVKRPILPEKIRHNCRGTLNDGSGPNKAWNTPVETTILADDRIDWLCIGDRDEVTRLLRHVTHLGRKRAAGFGEVDWWDVGPCEPWDDGFPIVRDGHPMRVLPADWPGLVSPRIDHRVPSPPYWDHAREQACAIP